MDNDDFEFDFNESEGNKLYQDKVKYRNYLETTFPWDLIYEWLTANHSTIGRIGGGDGDELVYFSKREFSVSYKGFNYKTGKEQEFWNRHKSFISVEELKQFAMGRVDETNRRADVPDKLDIGAVFNHEPARQSGYTDYHPVARELVFDIDSNDYDDVRTCCKGNTLCPKCWRLLSSAMRMVEYVLRDAFGFQHFMPVFSGGRGVHLWVSDSNAMLLNEDMRRSILGYLRLTDQSPTSIDDMHPVTRELYDRILLPLFQDHLIEEQSILSNSKQIETLKSILPAIFKVKSGDKKKTQQEFSPSSIIDQILEKSMLSDLDKWRTIHDTFKNNNAFELIYKIVVHFSAPRLDEAVSIGVNHLLKSPFCIHPRTQRLCVPIILKEIESFNPDKVPTLSELIENPSIMSKYRSIFKLFVNNLRNHSSVMDTDEAF